MDDLLLHSKSRLEASKDRLTHAFERLETAINKRFAALNEHDVLQQTLAQVQGHLAAMQQKNAELSTRLEGCNQERLQLKQAALDVFQQVEASIQQVELLLKDQNANR